MFETIKRLYDSGKITTAGVINAIQKGWITNEEAQKIL